MSEKSDILNQERADIFETASYVGLHIDTLHNADNDTIKRKIVRKVNPKLNLDEEDQHYINGRYEGLVNNIKKNPVRSLAQLSQLTRTDNNQDERSPREKFMQDTADSWMSGKDKKLNGIT